MHNAPSVSYPVGRCAFAVGLYLFFTGLASTSMLLWAFNQGLSLIWLLGVCALVWAAVCGRRSVWRSTGVLTWDGQVWCLHDQAAQHSDGELGAVHVSLDAQQALVLQWQPLSSKSATQWLWLNAANATQHWQALRRAVFAKTKFS